MAAGTLKNDFGDERCQETLKNRSRTIKGWDRRGRVSSRHRILDQSGDHLDLDGRREPAVRGSTRIVAAARGEGSRGIFCGGGEFRYTRLVATRKKLTYVGNHDGEVHDTVEILASGQVLGCSGAGVGGIKSVDIGSGGGAGVIRSSGECTFSWFVKGTSVLVLGVFIGYVGGLHFIFQEKGRPRK
ncbi:hypothetical protein FF1_020960 [Malus domestica]